MIGLIQLVGRALIWLNPFAGAIAITALIAPKETKDAWSAD
ncbi:MAG: hypothetical protein ACLQF1_18860 [Methyloceanibacter sp.]